MSTLTQLFTSIANAIRAKKGTSSLIEAENFPTEISTITTGTDTSDATAVANDILSTKTAYAQGVKLTGAMTNNGALSFTSSENNQTIPAGYTSGGTITGISIEDMSAYDGLLAQSEQLLYGNYVPKVTNGLLYSLNTFETFDRRIIDTGVSQADISSAYTIFISMQPTAWNNYRGVMGEHGGYNRGIVGFQYEDKTIRWTHIGSPSYADVYDSVKTLNTEYDMIVTYGTNKLNIWCNGTKIINDLANNDVNNYNNIIIGRAYGSSERHFAGKLGYCYIYDRVLSSAEMQQMQQYIEQVKEGIIV